MAEAVLVNEQDGLYGPTLPSLQQIDTFNAEVTGRDSITVATPAGDLIRAELFEPTERSLHERVGRFVLEGEGIPITTKLDRLQGSVERLEQWAMEKFHKPGVLAALQECREEIASSSDIDLDERALAFGQVLKLAAFIHKNEGLYGFVESTKAYGDPKIEGIKDNDQHRFAVKLQGIAATEEKRHFFVRPVVQTSRGKLAVVRNGLSLARPLYRAV